MNEFNHPIFGKVRTTLIDGNVYFYATDICNALGFKGYGSTYTHRYVQEEHLKQITVESTRGTRCINVISVEGVSSLCKRSKLITEAAFSFSNWFNTMCYATKYGKTPEKPKAEEKMEAAEEVKQVSSDEPQELEEHEEIEEEETMELNAMKIFNNPEFGDIRTEVINGEPWFCLSDVCKALELEQVSRVKTRLNLNGVTTSKVIDSMGRNQEATFVNEANLYKTIFQSRKESAERFTDWVTSEVLPSIRKTGSYQKPDQAAEPLNTFEQIRLLATGTTELAQQVTHLSKEVTELKTDMPLYGCEIDEVQQHVKRKGVQCLGGKDSEAYADGSIRSQVYKDIYSQLKREYGCVSTYKSIKRKYIADVHDFIDCYQLPTVLEEQIMTANAQQRLF